METEARGTGSAVDRTRTGQEISPKVWPLPDAAGEIRVPVLIGPSEGERDFFGTPLLPW